MPNEKHQIIVNIFQNDERPASIRQKLLKFFFFFCVPLLFVGVSIYCLSIDFWLMVAFWAVCLLILAMVVLVRNNRHH